MSPQFKVPVYEALPGERIRILLNYREAWRPVFWFKVGKDGSIYLNTRLKPVTSMKAGVKKAKNGVLTISYEDGQEIKDPIHLNGKISFHATGIINSAGQRFFREPIRKITKQDELCKVLFAHPLAFSTEQKVRKRDVLLSYPFDEQRPLLAHFLVAPKDARKLLRIKDAVHQMNLFFPFGGLEGVPDLLLQLVFFHSSQMQWPPYTYVIFGPVAMKPGKPS